MWIRRAKRQDKTPLLEESVHAIAMVFKVSPIVIIPVVHIPSFLKGMCKLINLAYRIDGTPQKRSTKSESGKGRESHRVDSASSD